MLEFLLFIIIVAIVFQWFIRRGKAMVPKMGELAVRGIDVDAQVVKKSRVPSNFGRFHYYLLYSFTLENNQSFSKQISTDFKLWDSMEEGGTLPVVYLAEDPNTSTTKDMIDQIRAAMPQKSTVQPDGDGH
jgi:hypothetical protein